MGTVRSNSSPHKRTCKTGSAPENPHGDLSSPCPALAWVREIKEVSKAFPFGPKTRPHGAHNMSPLLCTHLVQRQCPDYSRKKFLGKLQKEKVPHPRNGSQILRLRAHWKLVKHHPSKTLPSQLNSRENVRRCEKATMVAPEPEGKGSVGKGPLSISPT